MDEREKVVQMMNLVVAVARLDRSLGGTRAARRADAERAVRRVLSDWLGREATAAEVEECLQREFFMGAFG